MTRFLVVNDLHLQRVESTSMRSGYPGATARAGWLFNECRAGGSLADVDFVVSAGDLIDGGSLAAMREEFGVLRKFTDALGKPFYPCCGNHEIQEAEGDPVYEAPYREAFGDAAFDYVIPAGNAEIIVLNNAGSFHVTPRRRHERHAALARMIAANPSTPKILVCHVPLVAVRDEPTLRASFGHVTYRSLEAELLDLVDDSAGAVRLVISGHQHLTGAADRNGVRHFVVSGAASLPHDYAVVTIDGAAIDVDVRTLPEPLHDVTTNIHGLPTFSRDYTDSRHRSMLSYLRGNADERRFRVPLT